MVIEETIRKLPELEQTAALIYFLRPNYLMPVKARALQISQTTLRARLHRAYIILFPLLMDLVQTAVLG